jgi:hypothetical protein
MIKKIIAVTLLLAFSVVPVRAEDRCEATATEIATKVGLKTGERNKVAIPLHAEAYDGYGVFLICTEGPRGMSLQYGPANLGDPPPQDWFDFVGRTAAILTGGDANTIAMEARNCTEKARLHDGYFKSTDSVFILCDTDSSGGPVQMLLTERLTER